MIIVGAIWTGGCNPESEVMGEGVGEVGTEVTALVMGEVEPDVGVGVGVVKALPATGVRRRVMLPSYVLGKLQAMNGVMSFTSL